MEINLELYQLDSITHFMIFFPTNFYFLVYFDWKVYELTNSPFERYSCVEMLRKLNYCSLPSPSYPLSISFVGKKVKPRVKLAVYTVLGGWRYSHISALFGTDPHP